MKTHLHNQNVYTRIKCFVFIAFFLLSFFSFQQVSAQCSFAANPTILKTFGSGTAPYGAMEPSDYNFSTTYPQFITGGIGPNDGWFSFVNAVPDPFGNVWHDGPTDHTGDPNGYMMLVNADNSPGEFYRDTIMGLCTGIEYEFSSWIANVDLNNGRIKPDIKFEIRDANTGALIEDYETGDIGVFPILNWQKYSLTFNTNVQDVVLLLINNNPGGSGNDLVLDDIGFTPCLPSYEVTGPDSLCEGEDFTFTANAAIDYSNPVYQWQKKIAGIWTDIGGETNDSYSKTNIVSADSGWYRAIIAEAGNLTSELCRTVDSTHLSMKTGSITNRGNIAQDQTICYNTTPEAFTSTQDAVSILPFTYSWEKSEDLSAWTSFPVNTKGFSESTSLTKETYYRRKVKTSCTSTFSDTITIKVLEDLEPGVISDDQFLCEGVTPALFTETTATSGGDANYSYQWEISDDGLTWAEIAGATAVTYQSQVITQDQWFRRRDSDGKCAIVVTEVPTVQNRVRYTNIVKLTHHVSPKPIAQDIEQCQNTTALSLTATGTSLLWYTNPTGGTGNSTVPTYNTNTADTLFFYVSQTQNTCESARDTLQIIINPEPQLTVKDTVLCLGNSAKLNFKVVKTTGVYNYTWSPTNNLTVVNKNTVIAEPTLTTQYQLKVEDAAGCKDNATITVTINSNPKVSIASVDLCAERDTVLKAVTTNGTGTINYTWETAAGLVSTTNNTATVKPTSTTTYKVVVSDQNNCKDSTTGTVTLFSKPVLTASDLMLCKGDKAALTFQTVQATGDYAYTWTPTTNLSIQNRDNVTVNALADALYTVRVEDSKGCKDTATIDLKLHPEITVNVASVDLCAEKDTVLKAIATGGTGTLSYKWLAASGLVSTNANEATVRPLSTQEYKVIVTDANTCKDTTTSTVTINSNPKVSIASVDLCAESDTVLKAVTTNGTGTINYTWETASGLVSTTNNTATVKPTSTTAYKVVVSDQNNCKDSTTGTVTLFSKPVLTTSDLMLCKGEKAPLTFQTAQATGDYVYTWTPTTNLSIEDRDNVTVNALAEALYTVKVEDSKGCKDTATIDLKLHPEITVNVASVDLCAEKDTVLKAIATGGTGTLSYQWLGASGLVSTNANQATVHPFSTQEYKVIVTDVNTCKDTAISRVTVFPKPKVKVDGSDVCSGSPAYLNSQVSDFTGALTYEWSPVTGLNSATNANVVSNTTVPVSYTLIVKDGKGCRDTVSTSVGVTLTPTANIPHNDTLLCPYEKAILVAENDPTENYSFQWYKEDLNGNVIEVSKFNSIEVSEPGRYYVEVRNNGSCPVFSNKVIIEQEIIAVSAQASETEIYSGDYVSLTAVASNNVLQYTWDTPEGVKFDKSFSLSPSDEYLYTVEVQGQKCKATDSIRIDLLPSIIIPNGFSPDFDGKNDAWYIKGLSEFPKAEVQIFNRWGSIVYNYRSGYSHPWEGTNTKGQILPLGTYYYVINVKDKKGQVFKGSVTIIN